MSARHVGGLLAVVGLTAGCVTADLAKVTRELAKDPASACVTITTLYGTVRLARTALPEGTVECTADGLKVRAR